MVIILILNIVVTEGQTGVQLRRLVVPLHSIQMDLKTMNQNQARPTSLTWIWIYIQMNQNLRTTKTRSKVEEVKIEAYMGTN